MNVISEKRWQLEGAKSIKKTPRPEGTCLVQARDKNQPGYRRMDKKIGPMFICISLMLERSFQGKNYYIPRKQKLKPRIVS